MIEKQKATPEEQDRQRKAVDLRIAGMTYPQIADQLGYADKSGAYYAVQAALKREQSESVAELRLIAGERLDFLWRKAMADMTSTASDQAVKEKAREFGLKVYTAWAKLHGVNAPERLAIAGKGMTQEEFVAQFGELPTTTVDEDIRELGHDPVGDVPLIDHGNRDEDGELWANSGDFPGITSRGTKYVPSARVDPEPKPAVPVADPAPQPPARRALAAQAHRERPSFASRPGEAGPNPLGGAWGRLPWE